MRAELLALYAQADALVESLACDCAARDTRCCRFGITGREPYPTPVELEEIEHARAALGRRRRSPRVRLALAKDRACPLLSNDGRCTIYASRPLGCRTFFCDESPAPADRAEVQRVARAVASLSERFAPGEGPRPLTRALK
jgi:Fe-S-cluster containining protein